MRMTRAALDGLSADRLPLEVASNLLVVLLMLATSTTALAQAASTDDESRPIVLVGGRYGVPTRWTAGMGLVIPVGRPVLNGDLGDLRRHRGVEVEASAGVGGARLAVGPSWIGKPPKGRVLFASDLLGGIVRTWNSPRGANDNSTYLALEGGLTLLMVRFSAGAAHQVDGLDGQNATIFTWSIGVQTGW